MGDFQQGVHVVVRRVRVCMTPRRAKILIGVMAAAGGAAAVACLLLRRVPSDIRPEAGAFLAIVGVLTVTATAALITIRMFVRVRDLGWGPRGALTAESERELREARHERRRPNLTDDQGRFMTAWAAHVQQAQPPHIALRMISVPLFISLLLAATVVGSSLTAWLSCVVVGMNLVTTAHMLVMLGRSTRFSPLSDTRSG